MITDSKHYADLFLLKPIKNPFVVHFITASIEWNI